MALNASDVSAGDSILAAHQNAIIDDMEQHVHEGTDTTKVDATDLDTYPLDQNVKTTGTPVFATIAPGGNESLAWDVVEFDLDGTTDDQVAYTLDGVKCKGMFGITYDVSEDDIYVNSDVDNVFHILIKHDGANLAVGYGASLVAGDDARVIVFTVL